jgi:phospholipid/cholesterol/gamma-HCH transport system ATP-binding protein
MIIGRSGSGKSVLAKCMVGLHLPEEGEVLYEGQNFLKMNIKEKVEIRKNIGMLFQASALFDSLTVEENVMFPLTMFTTMSRQEMLKRAEECLERVNLTGSEKLYPSETSGGMQKRIAIARAIAMKPKFLFCDEPNSGLDPQTSIVIDNLIHDITKEMNITTVVISHDMNSVIEIGDQIMFINQGMKWWEGDKEDILNTTNKELNDFVYASKFMQTVREKLR